MLFLASTYFNHDYKENIMEGSQKQMSKCDLWPHLADHSPSMLKSGLLIEEKKKKSSIYMIYTSQNGF